MVRGGIEGGLEEDWRELEGGMKIEYRIGLGMTKSYVLRPDLEEDWRRIGGGFEEGSRRVGGGLREGVGQKVAGSSLGGLRPPRPPHDGRCRPLDGRCRPSTGLCGDLIVFRPILVIFAINVGKFQHPCSDVMG